MHSFLAEQSLFFVVICIYGLAFLFYALYLFLPRLLGKGRLAFSVLLLGALVLCYGYAGRSLDTSYVYSRYPCYPRSKLLLQMYPEYL